MLIDARRDMPRSAVPCDVCIVGGGPAGITLARELDDGKRAICLLECGGPSYEAAAQALFAAAAGSAGYPPLQSTRLAALGGSTRVWAGWCRPLDAIDFEHRPEIPSSGWPISRADLDPYYATAHAALALGPIDYDPAAWAESSGNPLLPLPAGEVLPILFRRSNVDFGREYGEALRRSRDIRAWLHATASRVRYSPDGARVTGLDVRVTGRRRTFEITPRILVLAAGGIENARLLLLSDASGQRGPANRHGVVGRYFTEHCYVDAGTFRPNRRLAVGFCVAHPARSRAEAARGAYSPAPSAMRQRALLNGGISLRPAYESSPAFEDPSTQALLRLWDIWRRRAVPYGIARDALRAMAAPHKAVQALRSRLGASDEGHHEWRLRSLVECTADPDNRVELGDERDALGRPRPRVRWRVRELDLRSARETHGVFAEVVQRAGHGEVSVHEGDWNERMQPALHHLGTTRMHDDPARGVVDRDARVHGIDNLYVAGGSVFTTAGFANPTLTILALTLRLARHLKGQ